MDYSQSKALGDVGERRVGEVLEHYRKTVGWMSHHSDVLLSVGSMTAQLDHLLIDRRGVLILEVKTWNDAWIRGTADESKWTVGYGKSRHRIQNPLKQLSSQRNALTKALRDAGCAIHPDALQSVIVFVGTDTSGLELDSESRRRVTTIEGLPGYLAERQACAPVMFGDVGMITAVHEKLLGLNRSRDPEVQARHAAYRQGLRGERKAPPVHARQAAAPPPVRRQPSGYAPARSSYSYHVQAKTRASYAGVQAAVIAAMVLIALLLICIVPTAMKNVITGMGRDLGAQSGSGTGAQPQQPIQPAKPTLEQAKSVLRTVAPDVYEHAAHLDAPSVVDGLDGTATFTWEYVSQPTPRSAVVKKFALTLRADGSIGGMTASD